MSRKHLLTTIAVAVASAAVTAAAIVLFSSPALPSNAMALSGMAVPAAGAPTVMTYQGYLTDAGGAPIDGSVNLVFTIHPTESSPTVLWTETHNGVQVTDGYFTILLGETTPLDAEVFSGEERWLAVTVNGTPMPRQRIAAVPYAIQSAGTPPGCRVIRETAQTIDHDTLTLLAFSKVISDTTGGTCWSDTPSENQTRLYAPESGYYMSGGGVALSRLIVSTQGTVVVLVRLHRTSSSQDIWLQTNGMTSVPGDYVNVSVATGMFYMETGDYVEIWVIQKLNDGQKTTMAASEESQHTTNGWLMKVD